MENSIIDLFKGFDVKKNLLSTGILIVIILISRAIAIRSIRNLKATNSDTRRQWIVQVKNLSMFLIFLGIFIVWANELRTFALSVVAIAVAIVIATKELILCFMGGVFKIFSSPFRIGDRIEINSFRGDVIDHTILSTTLFEIGPSKSAHQYTGKTLCIPNSLFLNSPIINETKSRGFKLHTFSLFHRQEVDIQNRQKELLSFANEICSEYVKETQKDLEEYSSVEGLEPPSADPRVFVAFPSFDRVELIVRVPVPALRSGRIEQSILKKYTEWIQINDAQKIELTT
jgi:small-conductance mechanosensitive channel